MDRDPELLDKPPVVAEQRGVSEPEDDSRSISDFPATDNDDMSLLQTRTIAPILPDPTLPSSTDVTQLQPGKRRRRTRKRPSPTAPRDFLSAQIGESALIALPEARADWYELREPLARGGMGRIREAYDRRLGRTVALKELLRDDRESRMRFDREARITGRLQHPAIVPIYEAGTLPNGDRFYAMRLVAGDSFDKVVEDKNSLQQRLSLLPHLIHATEALAYAHRHGVIHRDLKPSNILVGEFGETVVIDWGLAKVLSSDEPSQTAERTASDLTSQRAVLDPPDSSHPDSSHPESNADGSKRISDTDDLTMVGVAIGTPAYMPPEQAKGTVVDRRADVYALGAILYHLLAGRRAYAHLESADAILRCLNKHPPEPLSAVVPDCPVELITIVEKAMARDPAERYPSAEELSGELLRFQTGQLVASHDYSTWTLIKRYVRRHRAVMSVIAIAFALLLTTLIVSVDRVIDERNHAQSERSEATAAKVLAERQRNRLLLLQAESSLIPNPTATLAWLRRLPSDPRFVDTAQRLYEHATAMGVARHIVSLDSWGLDVEFSRDGRYAAIATKSGTLSLIDTITGDRTDIDHIDGGLSAIAVSPDGRHIAVAGDLPGVRIWNMEDGTVRELIDHRGSVIQLTFSMDGRRLHERASGGHSSLWDVSPSATHAPLVTTSSPTAFTPLADRYIRSLDDGTHILVDVRTGAEERRIQLPTRSLGLTFSPDGTEVAGYGDDYVMRVIDFERGTSIELGDVFVRDRHLPVVYSRRGEWLATAGPNWTVRLWNRSTGQERTLTGHNNGIYDIALSDDGTLLASASDDGTARLWQLDTDSVQVLKAHRDDVVAVDIDASGDQVATASYDGTVAIWPIRWGQSQIIGGHESGAGALKFTDDDHLIAGTRLGEIRRWQVHTGESDTIASPVPGRTVGQHHIAASGTYVLVENTVDQTVERWQLSDGSHVTQNVPWGAFASSAITPDGRVIASTDKSGRVLIWWPDTGQTRSFDVDATICSVSLPRDGNELALVVPSRVLLWRPGDDLPHRIVYVQARRTFCGRGDRMRAVYSDDGAWLAVSGDTAGLTIIDRRTKAVRHLSTSHHDVVEIRISPHSDKIAAALGDRSVRLWQLDTGASQVLGHHGDIVLDIAFSPDGQSLATASYDHTVRVWEFDTGRYRVLLGHSSSVDRVVFSKSGRWVATGSKDRSVRLWDLQQPRTRTMAQLQADIRATTSVVINADDHVITPTIASNPEIGRPGTER